jgi:hypothetical protein
LKQAILSGSLRAINLNFLYTEERLELTPGVK